MRQHPLRIALALALAGVLALPAQAQQKKAPVKQPDAPAASSSSAAAVAAKADDSVDLDDIRNFTRVYHIIQQAYVEKLDNKTIMKAAISGMLQNLDPHSEYLDKEGLDELDEDTTGQYGGLGIEVLQVDGLLKIVSPIDDTPASRAGIKPGDTILKVDGMVVDQQNIDDAFKKLRGDPGSKVVLTILHEKSDKPIDMPLVRERINVTSVKVRQLEPGYVYIRLSQFQEDTATDLEKKLGDYIKKNGARAARCSTCARTRAACSPPPLAWPMRSWIPARS